MRAPFSLRPRTACSVVIWALWPPLSVTRPRDVPRYSEAAALVSLCTVRAWALCSDSIPRLVGDATGGPLITLYFNVAYNACLQMMKLPSPYISRGKFGAEESHHVDVADYRRYAMQLSDRPGNAARITPSQFNADGGCRGLSADNHQCPCQAQRLTITTNASEVSQTMSCPVARSGSG